MQLTVGNADAKGGFTAADLVIGVALGKTDRDNAPEIIAARKCSRYADLDEKYLGGDERRLLAQELQEQAFFIPLEAKYGRVKILAQKQQKRLEILMMQEYFPPTNLAFD